MKLTLSFQKDGRGLDTVQFEDKTDPSVEKFLGCITYLPGIAVEVWKPNGLNRPGQDIHLEQLKEIVRVMEMAPEQRRALQKENDERSGKTRHSNN